MMKQEAALAIRRLAEQYKTVETAAIPGIRPEVYLGKVPASLQALLEEHASDYLVQPVVAQVLGKLPGVMNALSEDGAVKPEQARYLRRAHQRLSRLQADIASDKGLLEKALAVPDLTFETVQGLRSERMQENFADELQLKRWLARAQSAQAALGQGLDIIGGICRQAHINVNTTAKMAVGA